MKSLKKFWKDWKVSGLPSTFANCQLFTSQLSTPFPMCRTPATNVNSFQVPSAPEPNTFRAPCGPIECYWPGLNKKLMLKKNDLGGIRCVRCLFNPFHAFWHLLAVWCLICFSRRPSLILPVLCRQAHLLSVHLLDRVAFLELDFSHSFKMSE